MNGIAVKRFLLSAGVPPGLVARLKRMVYSMGTRCYRDRLAADAELQRIVEEIRRYGSLTTHYSHTTYGEQDINTQHLTLQLAVIIRAVRQRLFEECIPDGRVLDVGDPDGMLVKLGAGGGFSLNILNSCVTQIRRRGGCAVQGDLEALPFAAGSVDTVICCETIEHLENPIRGLKELARVARRRILVSVPYVAQTRIHQDNYQQGVPEVENHVFEFSREDFERVATHAGLRIVHYDVLNLFPPIWNPIRYWIIRNFYWPLMFPKFQFIELRKTDQRSNTSQASDTRRV